MIEAGKNGGVADFFAPHFNRLCKAIEKEIKNVSKN